MRKKLLALLLAAALALSLLAGCGGGESVASALLKLLDGRYPNISIEIDPELEADLRQAIRKAEAENAGDDDAVIRAALEKLVGSTVTFRKLGEGQQGATAFDLVFYSGSDPGKAAQAAYSQWNIVFDNVPDDGQYDTSLAMVETNSGVWMLVKATVEKAGTVDKPDKDDDPEPEPDPDPEPTIVTGTGFTYNVTDGIITMKSEEDSSAENDLQNLFTPQTDEAKEITDARNSGFDKITIELEADKTYTVNTTNGPLADTFKGELLGNNATVTITGGTQGLFNRIGDYLSSTGTIQDVDIEVAGTIEATGINNVGAVAGDNYGTIQNCHVAGTGDGKIIGKSDGCDVGGIAGWNNHIIQGCSTSVGVQDGTYTGGVVGYNYGGKVIACYSTGNVTIPNPSSIVFVSVSGIVGYNDGGTVTACYHAGGTVSGDAAGGVVGENYGNVYACYHANGTVSGNPSGGVVGRNYSGCTVTACYWSGNVDTDQGIGTGGSGTTKVEGNVTWRTAYEAMIVVAPDYYEAPVNDTTPPKLNWEN